MAMGRGGRNERKPPGTNRNNIENPSPTIPLLDQWVGKGRERIPIIPSIREVLPNLICGTAWILIPGISSCQLNLLLFQRWGGNSTFGNEIIRFKLFKGRFGGNNSKAQFLRCPFGMNFNLAWVVWRDYAQRAVGLDGWMDTWATKVAMELTPRQDLLYRKAFWYQLNFATLLLTCRYKRYKCLLAWVS
ncbi:hypothetical protein HNY73_004384 [Argiope bruennichi]|uniref:Uncharacterized protein n=1 Tax=Argiope bruennichi TaxID=94029 RepID=A0A8T0FNT4_ARGBR|nr:hypothetical protein HNY73_004384 [Argiope bruennichi]